ncbi:MAG: hypothetical protein FWD32_01070 [Firmicutes bacterium]|nr:hypothetical protein [Bacillota bacterium]
MKFKVSGSLKKLAKVFLKNGTQLFIVGGFVRDAVRGVKQHDIDLASQFTPEQLLELGNKNNFRVKLINTKLGTVLINGKYEHTTFRTENYAMGGAHTPSQVVMTKSLEKDSWRRDFTINAMYYNLNTKQLIDLYCGQVDVANKVIRQIHDQVFKSDGLRILRMVRFACTLGYAIEKETLQSAKEKLHHLNDISVERIYNELEIIMQCGGLPLLWELGLYKDVENTRDILSFGLIELKRLKAPNIRQIQKVFNAVERVKKAHQDQQKGVGLKNCFEFALINDFEYIDKIKLLFEPSRNVFVKNIVLKITPTDILKHTKTPAENIAKVLLDLKYQVFIGSVINKKRDLLLKLNQVI